MIVPPTRSALYLVSMKYLSWRWIALATAVLLQACSTAPSRDDTEFVRNAPVFASAFESGSIGRIKPLDRQRTSWQLTLKNDNDDATLPASFRTWFYFDMGNLSPTRPVTLQISGFGSRYPVMPVYSYDQKTWQHFRDEETVWQDCDGYALLACKLTITKAFTSNHVWIARTFPYTTQDLTAFLASIAGSPHLQREILGVTPVYQRPIELLTINDPDAKIEGVGGIEKKYIWIHARTHPGETGPSYVLEGLIPRLLADDDLGRSLRSRYIFKIVPMHNPDGVIAGNYRTTPASINLEENWTFEPDGSDAKGTSTPPPLENQALLRRGILPVLQVGGQFELALNMHSSNAKVDMPAFFLPHFGDDAFEFGDAGQRLWQKQQHFIALTASRYDDRIGTENEDGGTRFLSSAFPETWWWRSQQDKVTAMTLETTYGRGGFDHWVTQADLRQLGVAIAQAIDALGTSNAACAFMTGPVRPGCADAATVPSEARSFPIAD